MPGAASLRKPRAPHPVRTLVSVSASVRHRLNAFFRVVLDAVDRAVDRVGLVRLSAGNLFPADLMHVISR